MTDSVFMWQELEEEGEWGLIAAIVPSGLTLPLVCREAELALNFMRQFADLHEQSTGRQVRLARYDFASELVMP